jgi:dihydrofolate reductase (trimethoprim resistance protein)
MSGDHNMYQSDVQAKFNLGDYVRKTKGSEWHGIIVGTYSTELTPEGYAVESYYELGSVQIYPASALQEWSPYK